MTLNKSQKEINLDEQHLNKVCDLRYLSEMMGGKNNLITGVMDTFIKQIPEELNSINIAISKNDYPVIKSFAHTMKSSVSIMGISVLIPVLVEMQNLGAEETNIERIKELNETLKFICRQAIDEIELEKRNYV